MIITIEQNDRTDKARETVRDIIEIDDKLLDLAADPVAQVIIELSPAITKLLELTK